MIVNRICQSSGVSTDFTERVSALISIFGEISLESLKVQRKLKAMLVVEDFLEIFLTFIRNPFYLSRKGLPDFG